MEDTGWQKVKAIFLHPEQGRLYKQRTARSILYVGTCLLYTSSSFKDWICPQSMEFSKDCFKINERFGRVLYMQDYASYVKDDMISEPVSYTHLDVYKRQVERDGRTIQEGKGTGTGTGNVRETTKGRRTEAVRR